MPVLLDRVSSYLLNSVASYTTIANSTTVGQDSHHVVANQIDRILVVGCANRNGTQRMNTITYGGQSFTEILGCRILHSTGAVNSQMFYLINPPTGTNTFVFTATSAMQSRTFVAGLYGVDQANPLDGTGSGVSSGTTGTRGNILFPYTLSAGSAIVDSMLHEAAAPHTMDVVHTRVGIGGGKGTSPLRPGCYDEGTYSANGSVATAPGSGDITLGWSNATADNYAYSVCGFRESGGGTTPVTPTDTSRFFAFF